MPTVVQYETVKELARTAGVQVCRVKTADKVDGSLVLKRCVPPDNGLVDRKAMVRSFLDKARAQQAAAAPADSRWVKVHEVAEDGDGAWFVSDYYAGSAQKLINGQVRLSPPALLALVRSVMDGLARMHAASDRHHGNLKPTNVLIDATDEIEEGDVFLCDPADGNDPAAHDGAAEDLFQVGQLIHQLVLHRPFRPVTGWPIEPSPAWSRLGHAGRRWREFCNHLLHPDALARPGSLAEARRELDRVAQRPLAHTLAWTVAAMLVVAALGACGFLYRRSNQIARDVDALKSSDAWFCAFDEVAVGDDAFAKLAAGDAHLKQYVLDPRSRAANADGSADQLGHKRLLDLCTHRPSVFERQRVRELRSDVVLIAAIEQGIKSWDFLGELAVCREACAKHQWKKPRDYLDALIINATPPSEWVGTTINTLLENRKALASNLAGIEQTSRDIDAKCDLIRARAGGSQVPIKFAAYISGAAAAYSGEIKRPDDLKKFVAHLQGVSEAATDFTNHLPEDWAKDVDIAGLREYEKAVPPQPLPADFVTWRDHRSDFVRFPLPPERVAQLEGAIDVARQKLETLGRAPRDAQKHVEPATLAAYQAKLPELTAGLKKLRESKYLRADQERTLNDFGREVDSFYTQVASALAAVSPEPVDKWRRAALARFDGDESLKAAWRKRLEGRVSDAEASRLATDWGAYLSVQRKVAEWATAYAALPNRFPAPDIGDKEFNSAIQARRQADLAKALARFDEAEEPNCDDPPVARLAQDYGQWVENARQVLARCQWARRMLDESGSVDATGPNGLSLADLETELKNRMTDYPSGPVGERIAEIVGKIAELRKQDSEVAALAKEAETLEVNDHDLRAALDRYKRIRELRPRDRGVETKCKELSDAIERGVRDLLDRAEKQAGANDFDRATDTLNELDQLSPGLADTARLRNDVEGRRQKIELEKGVEQRIRQARALLRDGKPDAAQTLLANDKGFGPAAQLCDEIDELKRSSLRSALAGDRFLQIEDYAKARELYGKAIAGGNPYAMFKLGLMLRDGTKQPDEARKWLLRAADANEPGAMRALAQGAGLVEANQWVGRLQKLSEAENARAQFQLGEMYRLGEEAGEGVKRNTSKAIRYYQRAADNRLAAAAYQLAVMYEASAGDSNPALVRQRYQTASDLGSPGATQWLQEHPRGQRGATGNNPVKAPTGGKKNTWVTNPEAQ